MNNFYEKAFLNITKKYMSSNVKRLLNARQRRIYIKDAITYANEIELEFKNRFEKELLEEYKSQL